MAHFARLAAMLVAAGLFVGGCAQQPDMSAAGAAGWPGTAPNTQDTIRFVVIADRTSDLLPGAYEQAVADINLLQPDLVISVGDSIEGYTDDAKLLEQEWQEFDGIVRQLKAPYFYCAGNHDVDRSKPGSPTVVRDLYQSKHSVRGKSYYSFHYKNSHFVVLDSSGVISGPAFADQQSAWLRSDIAKAKDAEHIFVFYHHPLFTYIADNWWSTLASILPKDKTTVFNGHNHKAEYRLADGFPTFVLPATAAKGGTDAASERMFAYVAVNGGKPTISFVPTGAIKPESYPQTLGQMEDMVKRAAILGEVPADGGKFNLDYRNPSAKPISVAYQFSSADWTINPASGKADIPAYGSTQVQLTAQPSKPQAQGPKIVETFAFGAAKPIPNERRITTYQSAKLGKLASITVDGKDSEWTNVTPFELAERNLVFQNRNAWKGPADSSSSIRIAASGQTLGIFIDVKDDQLITDRDKPWEQDGLEISWDVRPQPLVMRVGTGMDVSPPPTLAMTTGAGQIAIVPADGDGPAKKVIWIPAGKEALAAPESVKTFSRRVEGGYVIELAIPFAELGLAGGTLSEGMIKVNLAQDDLDGSGAEALLKRLSLTGNGDFSRSTAGYARFMQK